MNSVYCGAALTLLCLMYLTLPAHADEENKENEYLRFGRENTNGYIRFGRNDPFLRFGKKNDPFLRFGRQDPFLRFGRQDPFLRFGRQDPFLRFGRETPFLRFGRGDPYLRFGRGDPYLRFGRGDPYLRFGRGDPYLRFGKNDPFLRFGKSMESEMDSGLDALTIAGEQRLFEEDSAADRRRRSTVDNGLTREITETESDAKVIDSKVHEDTSVKDIRNAPYMRFGKKSEIDEDEYNYDTNFLENEFSRFLRSYAKDFSLPRFGKRREPALDKKHGYMRFGRSGI